LSSVKGSKPADKDGKKDAIKLEDSDTKEGSFIDIEVLKRIIAQVREIFAREV
jgi:hypothetical protein